MTFFLPWLLPWKEINTKKKLHGMRTGLFDKWRNGRTYCIYRKGLIGGRSQSPAEARTLHGRLQTNTLRRPGHILKHLAFYSTIHSQAISTVFAKVTTQPQALLRPYTWRVEKVYASTHIFSPLTRRYQARPEVATALGGNLHLKHKVLKLGFSKGFWMLPFPTKSTKMSVDDYL